MITLEQVTSIVESSNNQFAIRFEPETFMHEPEWIKPIISKIISTHKCDTDTAIAIACTSYGYYQILGANIYDNMINNYNIFQWIYSEAEQDTTFYKFITKLPGKFLPTEDITIWTEERFELWATHYNGPGNVTEYVVKMKEAINGLASVSEPPHSNN